jgi:hypothetical protein
VADQRDDLGSSGVFKAIVASARKFKRAVTGGEQELTPEVDGLGNKIAQAFVAGRLADVHAMGTPGLQRRINREQFVASWRNMVRDRGPFTGFDVANAGSIDIGFIPGLEDVPQAQFVAFLEITFSSPEIPLDHDKAFIIGAVMLEDAGQIRLGALHAR